jgi:hypothetical protein
MISLSKRRGRLPHLCFSNRRQFHHRFRSIQMFIRQSEVLRVARCLRCSVNIGACWRTLFSSGHALRHIFRSPGMLHLRWPHFWRRLRLDMFRRAWLRPGRRIHLLKCRCRLYMIFSEPRCLWRHHRCCWRRTNWQPRRFSLGRDRPFLR